MSSTTTELIKQFKYAMDDIDKELLTGQISPPVVKETTRSVKKYLYDLSIFEGLDDATALTSIHKEIRKFLTKCLDLRLEPKLLKTVYEILISVYYQLKVEELYIVFSLGVWLGKEADSDYNSEWCYIEACMSRRERRQERTAEAKLSDHAIMEDIEMGLLNGLQSNREPQKIGTQHLDNKATKKINKK